MAKLSELKIQQLKKELEQRGLLTSGSKAELQARLREAMEAEGVDVEEYVFQLEAEESSTKMEEKSENPRPSPGVDLNVIMTALLQLSSQISQFSEQISQWPVEFSSKINAELERNRLVHRKGKTDEDEVHQTDEKETARIAEDRSGVIKEKLEEADQGAIIDNSDGEENVIFEEHFVESEEIVEEVSQDDDCVVCEERLVEEDHQPNEEDIEMVTVQEEERVVTEIALLSETRIDERSSSFPFEPTGGYSETSKDVQNEEVTTESGAAESFLAGDSLNSLPSVGGDEENDVKGDDFQANVPPVGTDGEKVESEDSSSELGIGEDIEVCADASNATIGGTELASKDDLRATTGQVESKSIGQKHNCSICEDNADAID